MFPRRRRLPVCLALLALASLAGPRHGVCASGTREAQTTEELINWYYAAVFGTGLYAAGDRTVGILQLPFAYVVRRSAREQVGIKLNLPVSFGFYNFDFDDLAGGDLPGSVNTASVLPGLEFDVPVLHNWHLQPFAGSGYAWEVDGAGSAAIHHMGVKSQLRYGIGKGEFMLGNQLTHASYDAGDAGSSPLSLLVTGLNLQFPTELTVASRKVDFGIHLIHYHYAERLAFPLAEDVGNGSRNEFEFALSVSTRNPIPLGPFGRDWFALDRVGLAFRVGDEAVGARLFFSLPY